MEEKVLRDLYWKNAEVIDCISELIAAVQSQNYFQMNVFIPRITSGLKVVLSELLPHLDWFINAGLSWDDNYLSNVLIQIEQATIEQDYVLVGDLYSLQLMPALQDIQALISGAEISLVDSIWWDNNLKQLQVSNPALYTALLKMERKEGETSRILQVTPEPTSIGYFTLAVEKEDSRWYLHSNNNPLAEARIWARRNYQLEVEKYAIIGWGMGYHIRALLSLYDDMDLVVIEPNLEIIYTAFHYGDWSNELQKLTLICDENFSCIKKYMTEERELLFFRTELRCIQNKHLREIMEQAAIRKDMVDAQQQLFYQNARENIKNCDDYVDTISKHIKGKKVVIVAGGPSLDKNLHFLENKPKDVLIIAVGTVYKLLLKKGIAIDYVVISDARVYYQVKGIEDAKIPIILLATADRKISRYYQGTTYLACQQGYDMAANYANEHGYKIYTTGGSVVTLALDIAIRMKAKSIAFIGLDLAYYGTQMHASGTAKERFQGYELQSAKDWNGKIINTSKVFLRYCKWLEERIQEPDVSMPVVDATEGGIVKKGFIQLSLSDYLYNEKSF